MLKVFVAAVALLALFANAQNTTDKYTCSSDIVQVKYQGQPYYFPAQGKDDHFAAKQSCRFVIIIPDGYYAEWGFTAFLQGIQGVADALATVIVYGDIEMGTEWEGGRWNKEFDTLSDKIKIELQTAPFLAEGQFRFNVTWDKLVPPMAPVTHNIDDMGYNIVNLIDMDTNNVVQFIASSGQQVAIAADCSAETRLTDVTVYDGLKINNSVPHKNLDDTRFDDDCHSTQGALTLYNGIAKAPLQKCAVIGADARISAQFDKWTLYYDPVSKLDPAELSTFGYKNPCAVTLYAPDGQPIVLTKILFHLNLDSPIKAYEGIPTPATINSPVTTFTIKNHLDMLPYTFKTNVVTFVMSTGGATFEAKPVSIGADSLKTRAERLN